MEFTIDKTSPKLKRLTRTYYNAANIAGETIDMVQQFTSELYDHVRDADRLEATITGARCKPSKIIEQNIIMYM